MQEGEEGNDVDSVTWDKCLGGGVCFAASPNASQRVLDGVERARCS